MADKLNLTLEPRTIVRKGLNNLRKDGLIPGVIHDHGKESVHISVPYLQMVKTYRQAGKHHPLSLKVGTKNYMAMIKDVDFEPRKHQLRHVVFNAIKQNEEVEAEIPVILEEVEIPAERASLMVLKQMDHVQVRAFARNLPDQLTVDPSSLAEVGDRLTVADVKLPEGVTLVTEPEAQIAIVEMPKDQVAEANAAAAEMAAAEGTTEAEPVDEPAATADAADEVSESTEENKE